MEIPHTKQMNLIFWSLNVSRWWLGSRTDGTVGVIVGGEWDF